MHEVSIICLEKWDNRALQVRVYARNACVLEALRERRKPALRLPLVRVLAPAGFVRVACQEIKDCYCVFGNCDFSDEGSVLSADWFMKRENRVRSRPVDEIISLSLVL